MNEPSPRIVHLPDVARDCGVADENLLVAYVSGKLEAQARENFELRMLEDPELADAVEAEQVLRAALLRQALIAAPTPTPAPVARSPRPARRTAWLQALAAGLLVLLGFAGGRWRDGSGSSFEQMQAVDTIAIDIARGDPQPAVTEIRLPSGQSWVQLMLPRPDLDHARFAARLRSVGAASAAPDSATAQLSVRSFGGLLWLLDFANVAAGDYLVELRSDEAAAVERPPLLAIPVRLLKPGQ